MKKLLSVLMIVCFLAVGTLAFADDSSTTATGTTATTTAASDKKAAAITKLTDRLQFVKELQQLTQFDTIKANRTQILQLKLDVKTSYTAAKSKIKEDLKNKDSLTDDQIAALKAALTTVKADKGLIADTKGDIATQQTGLRAARKSMDINGVTAALNAIIGVQQTRISDLQKVITDINAITNM